MTVMTKRASSTQSTSFRNSPARLERSNRKFDPRGESTITEVSESPDIEFRDIANTINRGPERDFTIRLNGEFPSRLRSVGERDSNGIPALGFDRLQDIVKPELGDVEFDHSRNER